MDVQSDFRYSVIVETMERVTAIPYFQFGYKDVCPREWGTAALTGLLHTWHSSAPRVASTNV